VVYQPIRSMKLFLLAVLTGILLFTSSCSSSSKKQNIESLREEVIAIHDEVMPRMGELKTLRKEIAAKANELDQADSIGNTSEVNELRDLAIRLDDAFEGMFVWMRQFNSTYEGMQIDEIEAYLLDQREKVKVVNSDIRTSLQEAKAKLGRLD
jgi:hypothetical protein